MMTRTLGCSLLFALLVASLPAQVIRGTVLDADGKPHAGARLELVARDFATPRSVLFPRPIARTTTSARGHFTLDATAMIENVEYSLFVVSDRCVDHQIRGVQRPKGQELSLGVIRLERGAALHGKVVDRKRQPIAGAIVRYFPGNTRSDPVDRMSPSNIFPADATLARERQDGWVTRTDAAGAFRFAALPTGRGRVEIVKAGFTLKSHNVAPGADQTTIFKLRPGRTMRGKAVDQDGKPIAGARISFREGPFEASPRLFATTDAAGSFVLAGISRSMSGAFLSAYAHGYRSKSQTCDLAAPATLVMTREPRIRIRVTAGRKVVDQFAVRLLLPDKPTAFGPFQVVKAHEGIGIARGSVGRLEVRAPGYAPKITPAYRYDDPEHLVEVAVDKGCTLRRQIVDADGKPVANAKVSLLHPPPQQQLLAPFFFMIPQRQGIVLSTTTDAEGRIRIERVAARTYVMVVDHADSAVTRFDIAVDRTDTKERRLQLEPGVEVRGSVWQDGKPVAGARVCFMDANGAMAVTRSGPNGEFVLDRRLGRRRYTAVAVEGTTGAAAALSVAKRSGDHQFDLADESTLPIRLEIYEPRLGRRARATAARTARRSSCASGPATAWRSS